MFPLLDIAADKTTGDGLIHLPSHKSFRRVFYRGPISSPLGDWEKFLRADQHVLYRLLYRVLLLVEY